MSTLNTYKLSIRTELKAFLHLAIPLASAQVAQLATGFVDTVMMGHLGKETLAAGALASITFFSIVWTTSGVVMGISPLVAEAYGAGNETRIGQVTRQGVWLSLLLTIPIMIAIAHLEVLLIQLGQTATTVELAQRYLDIILWGLFPALGFAMLRGVVSALSQARPILIIVIAGTGFNILGNYALGFGKFGFPRLELAGLALASVLTLWGMFGALVFSLLRNEQFRKYQFFSYLHQIKPQILWQLVKLGVPIGVSYALEVGVFTAVSYLMGVWGTDELAAHQIVFQTINLLFMVPLGMSFAATARIGQWLGQQHIPGMRQAGFVS
ncbi:MAG TPA: MATE family efflux transporter, partial [Candidatus Obscuribacterales bacterium]